MEFYLDVIERKEKLERDEADNLLKQENDEMDDDKEMLSGNLRSV